MWDPLTFTAHVPGVTLRSDFYIFLSKDSDKWQQIADMKITSSNTSVCSVYLDASSSARIGANITASRPLILSVAYTCTHSGWTNVRVDIEIPPYNTVSFMWEKETGGTS